MKHRPHRKLFFPFGLISLSILPIIGSQKLAEEYTIRTKPLNCIELNYPVKCGQGCKHDFCIRKVRKMRSFRIFQLTSDTSVNAAILERAR